MSNIIKTKEVVTNREIVGRELARLQKLRIDRPEWWASESADWARRDFGDNLDQITPLAIEKNQEQCNICGSTPELDEKFMHLEFSFCDEYNCDMNICRNCLSSTKEELDG